MTDAPPSHDPRMFRTALRRIVAAHLDASLLGSFFVLIALTGILESSVGEGAFLVLLSAAGPAYHVLLHSLWGGQTLGKVYLGVMVVDLELRPLGARRALARESPRLLWSALGLVAVLPVAPGTDPFQLPGVLALTHAVLLWSVIDGLTMLIDRRRRALHDRIAGTVVIRVPDLERPIATRSGSLDPGEGRLR